MFLVLLLTGAVAAEWVEISQHRQETPRWTSRGGPTNNIYANYTPTDRTWHRGNVRTPHFGSIKRVQLQSQNGMFPSNAKNEGFESFGSVRAPTVIRNDHLADLDNGETNADEGIPHTFGAVNTKSHIKLRDQTPHFKTSSEKPYNKGHNGFPENAEIITKNEHQDLRISDSYKHIQSESHSAISKVKDKNNNEDTKLYLKDSDKRITKPSDTLTKSNINEMSKIAEGMLEDRTTSTQIPFSLEPGFKLINGKQEVKNDDATPELLQENCIKGKFQGTTANQCQDEKWNETIVENNSKINPAEVIWKLMKVVTDNISRNTRRSFRSKIQFLESLRNNILANIEERIELVWPDDAAKRARLRRAAAARGHVEFPSSESALMTISFLTFAVFLIKLVLQVIHTYKNKTMMVTPALVAAVGRAAAALRDRSRH